MAGSEGPCTHVLGGLVRAMLGQKRVGEMIPPTGRGRDVGSEFSAPTPQSITIREAQGAALGEVNRAGGPDGFLKEGCGRGQSPGTGEAFWGEEVAHQAPRLH